MRVLHVAGSYFPAVAYGGPIYSIHNLCRHLVREGVEVAVATTNADGKNVLGYRPGAPVDQDGVRVTYHRRSLPIRHVVSWPLRRAIRESASSYDLVHAHSSFCLHTLWAFNGAREEGVPFVISPRGSLYGEYVEAKSPWKKKAWLRLFERRILHDADAVHFTSAREMANALALAISPRRSEVIPNGIDPAEWGGPGPGSEPRGDAGAPADGPCVLYLGRLSWEKGIRHLVEAVALVRDEFPGLRLLLAGSDNEGYLPQVTKWSRELRVEDRVRYLGFLDRGAQRHVLEKCAFLALPSTSENFGMAAAEALFFARPVLLTPGVGIADDVSRAGAGIVVPQTASGIAAGIRHLLGDEDRLRAMGERGRRLVAEKFLWPAIAKRMIGVYEDILRTKRIP